MSYTTCTLLRPFDPSERGRIATGFAMVARRTPSGD